VFVYVIIIIIRIVHEVHYLKKLANTITQCKENIGLKRKKKKIQYDKK